MQPNNEAIIAEIAEAEKFLRKKLIELIKNGATTKTISVIVEALNIVSNSYYPDRRTEPANAVFVDNTTGRIIRADYVDLDPRPGEQ